MRGCGSFAFCPRMARAGRGRHMAVISSEFGTGGSGLTPGGMSGRPWLAQILQDVATDLAGMRAAGLTSPVPAAISAGAATALAAATAGGAAGVPAAETAATIATANAAAQTGAYVQADVQTIATLANANKTVTNQLVTDVGTVITELAALVTLVNQLRADLADARAKEAILVTLALDQTARQGENRTWIAEADTKLDAASSYALLTSNGP